MKAYWSLAVTMMCFMSLCISRTVLEKLKWLLSLCWSIVVFELLYITVLFDRFLGINKSLYITVLLLLFLGINKKTPVTLSLNIRHYVPMWLGRCIGISKKYLSICWSLSFFEYLFITVSLALYIVMDKMIAVNVLPARCFGIDEMLSINVSLCFLFNALESMKFLISMGCLIIIF